MGNSPESSGVRTQFLKRMVDFASMVGQFTSLVIRLTLANIIRLSDAGES